MPDRFPKETRSRIMSAIRSKDTKAEVALRKAFWAAGLRGWRKNDRRFPGTPDMAFPRAKIAVFVDGDFWHGRAGLPKSNRTFWRGKFRRNRERDREANLALRKMGWLVIRIPESTILKDMYSCAEVVRVVLAVRGVQT